MKLQEIRSVSYGNSVVLQSNVAFYTSPPISIPQNLLYHFSHLLPTRQVGFLQNTIEWDSWSVVLAVENALVISVLSPL